MTLHQTPNSLKALLMKKHFFLQQQTHRERGRESQHQQREKILLLRSQGTCVHRSLLRKAKANHCSDFEIKSKEKKRKWGYQNFIDGYRNDIL